MNEFKSIFRKHSALLKSGLDSILTKKPKIDEYSKFLKDYLDQFVKDLKDEEED